MPGIGISVYKYNYDTNLEVSDADRDADDLASAIEQTQSELYAQFRPQVC